MTNTVEELDTLVQRTIKLENEIARLNNRMKQTETSLIDTLKLFARNEELGELKIMNVLASFFGRIHHELTDSITVVKKQIEAANTGFSIEVVDGVNVLATDKTILVTKNEQTYSYKKLDGDETITEGMELFNEWFDKHQELFTSEAPIAVNIYYATKKNEDV